jgi:hypothetical protein
MKRDIKTAKKPEILFTEGADIPFPTYLTFARLKQLTAFAG